MEVKKIVCDSCQREYSEREGWVRYHIAVRGYSTPVAYDLLGHWCEECTVEWAERFEDTHEGIAATVKSQLDPRPGAWDIGTE